MKKVEGRVAIALVCVFLGVILAIQFKTVSQTIGTGVLPTQKSQQLAIELKKIQEERDGLRKEIDDIEEKISQYEKGESEKNVYTENLYKDLEKYRMFAGYADLKGPGVVLEINDPPMDVQLGEESSIIDDYDIILQIISVLNASEAEAISINDQRYTAYTEVVRAGNHIEVNGVSVGAPIVIKAIGDPSLLESSLIFKGGILWYLENYSDYIVQLKQEKNIEIPKYRKTQEFTYAKPKVDSAN
ncbi:DUF881 domain-containing protein [Anaerosalibacter massiliensis]|uniref:DUF881 domain-containing protein n=1 Tax=Anaerosalibacter massiliensis TaxID=1347392 RepID=A0A9X2MFW0_9FIRM|nr:DUF881 domain-containing protein [Anaerosalibacter massiliensis]MCR2042889.1 DUF881 domain-containing protein [Anaerosalibacter massiliensis]